MHISVSIFDIISIPAILVPVLKSPDIAQAINKVSNEAINLQVKVFNICLFLVKEYTHLQ